MLKKIIVSGLVASALSSTLFAENYMYVGASKAELFEESVNAFQFGLGGNTVLQNNIVIGSSLVYHKGKLEDASFNGIGVDIHLGYSPLESLLVYGIGSYQVQSISSNSSSGIGYGGGASYTFLDSFALALEYKTYEPEFTKYDVSYTYDTLDLLVKFVW